MNIRAKDYLEKRFGPMTFGTFVVGMRTMLDMSQVSLAKKLGVSRAMICGVEKGRILVSPELAVKIARVGGFPEDMAVRYCLQDQLRKAKIKMHVDVRAA